MYQIGAQPFGGISPRPELSQNTNQHVFNELRPDTVLARDLL